MARKTTSADKAAEKTFVLRPDGDWDYFPRGLSKPGYRVNSTLRGQLLAAGKVNRQQLAGMGVAMMALVRFGAPEVARSYPAIAPYALSIIIQVCVGLLVLIPLYIFVMRWDKSHRDKLLANAPAVEPTLSREEERAKRVSFGKLPLRGRILAIAFLIGVPCWMLYGAYVRFSDFTGVELVEGVILVLGAVFLGLVPVALIAKKLRSPRRAV